MVFIWAVLGLIWLYFWLRGFWLAGIILMLAGCFLLFVVGNPAGAKPIAWVATFVLPWAPMGIRLALRSRDYYSNEPLGNIRLTTIPRK